MSNSQEENTNTSSIQSVQNPKIKYVRQLHQKKHRDQSQRFLIEGDKLVHEALKAKLELELVIFSEPTQVLTEIPKTVPCYQVTPDIMARITTLTTPAGFIAVAKRYALPALRETAGLRLLSAGVQDPGNFGALLRLGEAMGVQAIGLYGDHVDPYHPKIIRGSMGSCFRQPTFLCPDPEAIKNLKAADWHFVAAEPHHGTPLPSFTFPEKTCLLLGSEGQGLSHELTDLADSIVTIPMNPTVESLNVTVAAAMLIYEYVRQRS